jgi:hypothetical protein
MLLALVLVGVSGVSASAVKAQVGACAVQFGPMKPDLIVDPEPLRSEIYLSEEHFSGNDCALDENCVTKPGNHLLLRFTTSTPNIGQAALTIGDPAGCVDTLFFEFSACHQHYHYHGYTAYRVWTEAGYQNWIASRNLALPANAGVNQALLDAAVASGDLMVGRKQGFCLEDSRPYPINGTAPAPAVYQSCMTNQGLSVGWADVYSAELPCQYVQITGIQEGTYVLENQVNPDQVFPESDYTNNTAAVRLYIRPHHGNVPALLQILE